MSTKVIYLDNNATTRACDESKRAINQWVQCNSNPSGSTRLSATSATLLQRTKDYLNDLLNLKNRYTILFTSGATESNCTLLRSVADSWIKRIGSVPHFISGSAEHHSIIECLRSMVDLGRAEVTLIDPNTWGIVDPVTVESAIKPNTALISIMYANNETGSINPVRDIATVAHKHQVPFHSDAVQMFGKYAIDMSGEGLDAISMSYHKIYGPMGVGMLIIRDTLIKGYRLEAQICGTQQGGLRGGTENMPGIAGAAASLVFNFHDRIEKNKRLLHWRNTVLDQLQEHYPVVEYTNWNKRGGKTTGKTTGKTIGKTTGKTIVKNRTPKATGAPKRDLSVVVMGPPRSETNCYIPNTLLMAVVDCVRKICNIKMKRHLENHGIIVSIGSACNTSSKKASHVLEAMRAPPEIKRGILRFSAGDYNTDSDIKKFITVFVQMLDTGDVWLD